ncbi:MAG TPA: glycosyltransferase family 39 protein, partial [Anaerolineaceae bacterium]|nr:glycosyltransferase family 39 protein [Anaerolineaceae bacterium]
ATINHHQERITVWFIFLLGLMLRLYQLGADSFWIDEIGVATAAQMPTVGEMLRIAHDHVMAMPLDYFVAWLFARLDTGEFWLRIPSALWGSFLIPIAFLLFRRLTNYRIALLTCLLLALSPLHIQYSQELRFYAALTFFYLLSTWLLVRSIENPVPLNWAMFTLVTVIGIFFHVYILLSIVNGGIWLWITHCSDREIIQKRKYYLRSVAILLITFLVALFAFGRLYAHVVPFLLNEPSFLSVLGTGLGWIPFSLSDSILPWVFGGLCMIFGLAGVAGYLVKNPAGRVSALTYAVVAQVVIISLLNLANHYFIAPRQFLFLAPFMLFFAASGIHRFVSHVSQKCSESGAALLSISTIAVLLLASAPALANYYRGHKGMAREICQALDQVWQPGAVVLVIPDFEVSNYRYYSSKSNQADGLTESMFGTNWLELHQYIQTESNPTYLVTPYPLAVENERLLKSAAFEVFITTPDSTRFTHSVWYRDGIAAVQPLSPIIDERMWCSLNRC